jgi:hypothetical protein
VDEHLRRIERAVATGESAAPLLAARLRTGTLTSEAVALAAYCGHEGAQRLAGSNWDWLSVQAIEGATIAIQRELSALENWIPGLESWGLETCVRGAVALAEATFPVWKGKRLAAEPRFDRWAEPLVVVEAAKQWLDHPTERNKQLVVGLGLGLPERMDPGPIPAAGQLSPLEEMHIAINIYEELCWASTLGRLLRGEDPLRHCLREAAWSALKIAEEADLRSAVTKALVQRALA